MWMSEVEMNVWMRGRAETRTASCARSMSGAWARARPAMTGPSTSAAMLRTASKSPGEAIGKPASMTSTPSRASWCAISSFSPTFSEMPGDCSPSRRVVSKMMTRSSGRCSAGLMSFLSVWLYLGSFSLGSRLRGRHALFPPKGEEKGEETPERHGPGGYQRAPAHCKVEQPRAVKAPPLPATCQSTPS